MKAKKKAKTTRPTKSVDTTGSVNHDAREKLGLTEIVLEIRHGRINLRVHREEGARHLIVYTYNDGDPGTAVTDTIFVYPTGNLERCIFEILMRQLDKPATYEAQTVKDWVDGLCGMGTPLPFSSCELIRDSFKRNFR